MAAPRRVTSTWRPGPNRTAREPDAGVTCTLPRTFPTVVTRRFGSCATVATPPPATTPDTGVTSSTTPEACVPTACEPCPAVVTVAVPWRSTGRSATSNFAGVGTYSPKMVRKRP